MKLTIDAPEGSGTVSISSLTRNIRGLTASPTRSMPMRSEESNRIKIEIDDGLFRWTDSKGTFHVPANEIESLETAEATHGRLKYRALVMTFANDEEPRAYRLLVVPNERDEWLQELCDDIATTLGIYQRS